MAMGSMFGNAMAANDIARDTGRPSRERQVRQDRSERTRSDDALLNKIRAPFVDCLYGAGDIKGPLHTGKPMPTTSSRFFDELAKLMTNAAGAAQGVRREIDTLVQAQIERVLNNLDLVKRE